MRPSSFSKRVAGSYVLDWLLMVVFGLICYGLNKLTPVYHPFSLIDLSISYPNIAELVSTADLVVASVIGPAVIIVVVSIFLVPGPRTTRLTSWKTLFARKIWEINVSLLGLALSLLTSLLLTTGMKNIFGKPRPDMLARCQPDGAAVTDYAVGGFASNGISPGWILVNQTICRQPDKALLDDGFRSFPSGHSSTSWAGLLYLALYLALKFGLAFPQPLPARPASDMARGRENGSMPARRESFGSDGESKPIFGSTRRSSWGYAGRRKEAAAPPAYLHFLLFVPIGTAIFICASRWFDYRHHGFDILFGSFIGILSSWYSFNMYHMPLGQSAGWSWGPRSATRAFAIGVGTGGWVAEAQPETREVQRPADVEMGTLPPSATSRLDTAVPAATEPYEYVGNMGTPGRAA